jgi:hypothetical protein
MSKGKTTDSMSNLKLIASDDKNPQVSLKAGMKLQVVGISLVDSKLKKARPGAARLCGGTSTCVALVDLGIPTTSAK